MTEITDTRTYAQILADLIDAGPELVQTKYQLFVVNDAGEVSKCCVIGKAMLGAGFYPKDRYGVGWDEIQKALGLEDEYDFYEALQRVENPVTGERGNLISVCVDLNNESDWSFDQISAWLRSLPTRADGEF